MNAIMSTRNLITNLRRYWIAFTSPKEIDSPTGYASSADTSLITMISAPDNRPSYKFERIKKDYFSDNIEQSCRIYPKKS